jgi:hypothetical protein
MRPPCLLAETLIKGYKSFKHLAHTHPTGKACQIELNQLADVLIP